MATVDWSAEALEDLALIVAYIDSFDPTAASDMRERLLSLGASLADFPNRGRPAAHDTRELTTTPPFVLRYEVAADVVTILTIRHGRRRPLDA